MLNAHLFYVTSTLVTSVFMAALAGYALRQRQKPGALWFAFLCLTVLIWSACGVAEVFSPTLEQKTFWSKVEYLGISTFPVFCLVFVGFFTGFLKKFSKRLLFLFSVPALTIGLTWTNELHHWHWTDIALATGQLLGHPRYEYGWYFQLHTFYSYALCGLSFVLLLWGHAHTQRGQQPQFRLLLASYLFPVMGSVSYLLDFIPFDSTPIGFAMSSMVFAWALFRHDFIAHLPLPYHQVFHHLDEAVMVLDHKENLLEFNHKAKLYFDVSDKDLRQPLSFPFWDKLQHVGRLEKHVKHRHLALNLTRLGGEHSVRGYLLNGRDITAQKKSEAMLEAQLEKLNALVITNDSLQHQGSREDVYREAIGVAFEMTHADLASLVLYDKRSDSLTVVASQHRQPRQDTSFVGKQLRRGEGLSWKALDSGKATFLKDLNGLKSSHADLEQATEWFGIPLLGAEGQPFGVFSVRINSPHKTLEISDKVFLEAIAQTCSNVLLRLGLIDVANAKASAYRDLYTSAERQARELALLDRIRTSIAKDLSPQHVLSSTVEAIYEVLGYALTAIYMVEDDALVLKEQRGYDRVIERLPLTVGVMARAIQEKQVIYLPDVTVDATFQAAIEGIHSEIALPLFDSQQVVGVLNVESRRGTPLSQDDVKLMTALSEQVSFALERSKLYEDLRQREERLRLLAENTKDIIAWHDDQGHFLYVTPALERIFGYRTSAILGRRASEFAHPDDTAYLRQNVLPRILRGEAFETNHYRVKHVDGRYLWVETFIQPLLDKTGKVTGYVASSRDITERKRLQEQMLEGALLYDSLTNLPNRALFMDRLQHAAQRRGRGQHEFAVLFLDLDRFKVVNDSLGHNAGDKLLKGIAERLQQCVRPQDTIARLGGDEFAILLEDMTETGAHAIAERIGLTLKKPFDLDGRDVQSTVSIGITLSQDMADPEQLLRNADVAMYHAKNNGRARYALFNTAMHEKVLETMQLEVELRNALERGEFRVHYQPIIELKSGQLSGVEALVRWYHPSKGVITPTHFISIAEDAGMISQLDHWVLREATRQVKTWQVLFGRTLTVSVNLSTKNFRLSDLAQTILSTLEDSRLAPDSLKLEITESVLMDNLETSLAQLQRLREAGVSLQIDDFGTGYSSLSYLHQLPLDSLKIDRSFVWQLGKMTASKQAAHGGEIVQTIISLARSLDLSVVAEGVETEAQRAALDELHCDYGQGFLFAKPLSADELEQVLRANQPFVQGAMLEV
jgi:diguanylate cyclase (GGDEF)-like protein/PAS domain S-box-containing protein